MTSDRDLKASKEGSKCGDRPAGSGGGASPRAERCGVGRSAATLGSGVSRVPGGAPCVMRVVSLSHTMYPSDGCSKVKSPTKSSTYSLLWGGEERCDARFWRQPRSWRCALRATPELTRGNRKSQFHEFTGELRGEARGGEERCDARFWRQPRAWRYPLRVVRREHYAFNLI